MDTAAPGARPQQFETTRWSLIIQARGDGTTARHALESLCSAYWFPLYAFVRRSGYARHDAEDLTQAFFTHMLESNVIGRAAPEKGRFRTFLLVSLRNFVSKQHVRATAQRRGGGTRAVAFDESAAEARLAVTSAGPDLNPSALFERDWALTLLEQALVRLEAEQRATGKASLFARVRHLLRAGPERGEYDTLAGELGVPRGTLAVTVHRLQQRYRALVHAEIMHTLTDPADLEDELRYVFTVLQN